MLAPWKKSYEQLRQHIKKQIRYFPDKGPSSQGYCFSSSHVWMWELDYKESWVLKKWCIWTVVLEKTLESPLDCKEIKPVILKEISPEYSLEDWWSWSSSTLAAWCKELTHWKRPWCWERLKTGGEGDDRGQDGWVLHRLNGHVFEQALGDGEGQGSLACCSPWGHHESDMTDRQNNNKI